VYETSAVAADASTRGCHPSHPRDILAEAPEWVFSGPEHPELASPRYHETHAELAHGNQAAAPRRLPASIAHEIKERVSSVVLNAETAQRLLNAQPTNMGAVRRLLARIVEDGMRTAAIVDGSRALIKKASALGEGLEINAAILHASPPKHLP